MPQNRAVIFSNGIADFHRSYIVRQQQPTEISIPVRKDHVADVLASLNVYGQVALKSPPSFRPSNEYEGALAIDSQDVVNSLVTRLSGARVEVERASDTVAGTLLGRHSEQEATGGDRIHPKFVVVLTNDGLQKIPFREVQRLKFLDEDVQNEIDKTLRRNFQHIKPHSTFVELALSTEQTETEAIIQYTIPAAAWKISYRLRQNEDQPFEFQGFAIVDNNTDEDWKDMLISVVTGEPITFSTDLADSKTPHRKHVDVVKETALGAVEVEEADFAYQMAGVARGIAEVDADARSGAMLQRARYEGLETAKAARMVDRAAADMETADVREVGDFCVFEAASPVTIAANRSAVIPVFQVSLDTAKTILHYKFENHPERPFRTIEFANETHYSLGRGVCTVYEDGTYAGSCIMPTTKPAGEALLPHALETGVRLRREAKQLKQKAVALKLAQGFCYTSLYQARTTIYRIKNNKDEAFQLILDHDYLLLEPDVQCTLAHGDGRQSPHEIDEALKLGFRVRFSLGPKEELALTVDESRVHQSRMQLVNVTPKHEHINIDWLEQNLVQTNGPLARDPAIANCLAIQRHLDAKGEEIQTGTKEIERLAERQDRLRKNITTGGHDDQTNRWKTDLGRAEDKIVELEDVTIPRMREEQRAIRAKLRDALVALSAEWKAN